MKWHLVNSSSRQEIYELRNNDEKVLTIYSHPDKGTLRIATDEEKRVFLIGKEGFLRRRIVLRNEYGIRMGQLIYNGIQENQGSLEVDDEEFYYHIGNGSPVEATIFKNSETLLICELPAVAKDHDLLILALGWYITTAVKIKIEEYA
jgi:hypothetical protein